MRLNLIMTYEKRNKLITFGVHFKPKIQSNVKTEQSYALKDKWLNLRLYRQTLTRHKFIFTAIYHGENIDFYSFELL